MFQLMLAYLGYPDGWFSCIARSEKFAGRQCNSKCSVKLFKRYQRQELMWVILLSGS